MRLKLRRELGLFEATMFGVGIILGAGIYALIGKAALAAGNSVWISFIFGAVISALTGLSYAELSTMYPKDAAEYTYVKKAYASKFLAFMIGWLIIFTGIISASTVALGFSAYFKSLFNTPLILTALILIVVSSYINFHGIRESTLLTIISTVVEMTGLLIIIFFGLGKFGSVDYFEMPNAWTGIFSAATLVFFAYIGFEEVVNLAEETKKPTRNIPRALIFSILITTLLYMLVSISAVSLANWKDLGNADDPLTFASRQALGDKAFIMSLIALFATSNTVLIILVVTSRMIYGMASQGSLPRFLAKIHMKTRTPAMAVIAMGILSMVFVFLGKIEVVANITSLGAYIAFAAVNLSLVWLRFTKPHIPRQFKVPLNIGRFPVLPFLGAIFCVFMIYQFELTVMLVGLVILIAGAVVYWFRREKII